MKRCPQCGREYDSTMTFCLDDGAQLLYGPASMDEPATAILSDPVSTTESPTQTLDPSEAEATKLYTDRTGDAAPRKSMLMAGIAGTVLIAALAFAGYWFFGGGSSSQIDSIAVMPFVNETGDSEVEYLSDGMTDTLIASLSKVPSLSVKASSTVFHYKGKNLSPKKVGEELLVDAVLLGKVSQRGSDMSLRLELVDAVSEDVLWSETYDKTIGDLASLQKDIASRVTRELQIRLSGEEEEKLSEFYSANPEAYQALLKGRHHWKKRGAKGIESAIVFFEKAIELDPEYALAWSGLADSYSILPGYTTEISPAETIRKARAAAEKAVLLGPDLAEAHTSLGMVHAVENEDEAAIAEYKKAIELDPKYATARHFLGNLLASIGRDEEAIAAFRTAVKLEPLSVIINRNFADVLFRMRKYKEAEEQYKKVLEIDPDTVRALRRYGTLLAYEGRFDEAYKMLNRSVELGHEPAKLQLGVAYLLAGDKEKARGILADEEGRDVYSPEAPAGLYTMLGEKDRAFELLNKGIDEKRFAIKANLRSPEFDPLREDPRFAEVEKRLKIPD